MTVTKENVWGKIKTMRLREWLIVAGIAMLLLIFVVVIFQKEEKTSSVAVVGTDTEQKLASILGNIDGVGEVQVMIGEGEDGQKSVVVVCDGARSLQVIMDVREAAAAAVGTHESQVKVYIKENK